MSTNTTEQTAGSVKLLWFCHVCQRLIVPVDAPQKVDEEGNHYCAKCPVAEPKPGRVTARRSRATASSALMAPMGPPPAAPVAVAPSAEAEAEAGAQDPFRTKRRITYAFGGVLICALVGVCIWQLWAARTWQQIPTGAGPMDQSQISGGDSGAKDATQERDRPPEPPGETKEAKAQDKVAQEKAETAGGPTEEQATKKEEPQEKVEPPPESAVVQPPPEEPPPEDFGATLRQAVELSSTLRLADAQKTLEQLKARYTQASWWAKQAEEFSKAETQVKEHAANYTREAGDVQKAIPQMDSDAGLRQLAVAWQEKAGQSDELVSGPAQAIVKAATERRAELYAQAREKEAAELGARLEPLEALLKNRQPQRALDSALKTLDELGARLLDRADLGDKVAERAAALRFHLEAARSGEISFFRAATRTQGPMVELSYDFSDPQQLGAWTYDRPQRLDRENAAFHDAGKGAVVLKAKGEHAWEGRDRKDMGFLRLPFCFGQDLWMLEADAAALNPRPTTSPPDYGILVWDGAASVLRLGLSEVPVQGVREVKILLAGSMERNEKYSRQLASLPVKSTDGVRLRMTFGQGHLSCAALCMGRPANINLRIPLPFAPRYFGLYLRNRDKEAPSAAVFDNVKFTGIPNPDLVRRQAAVARESTIANAKAALRELAGAEHRARDQAAKLIVPEWAEAWKFEQAPRNARREQLDANGRQKVWLTECRDRTNFNRWVRQVALEPGKEHYLRLEVCSARNAAWVLLAKADDIEVWRQEVRGEEWQAVNIPLTYFAGHEARLELVQSALRGAEPGLAYWDAVRLSQK